ncbi:transcription initiation protein [Pedobacter ginsengisoli]|uniref:Transcription initiation protein n=1 Tax=Pedobacter ginsengisoli TaxID=363852 RepID=A0A2D1U697_9SPHI|nr:YciI family protein [Pedobacter ginsengisoli]ATP57126.1 transcription initiation protein [Pedobacter ginsengisoli]
MKEFLFVFRNDYQAVPKGSPEEMQAETKKWMDWIGGIAAQNKLVDRGNRLASEGNTLKPGNVITDGPFMEIKEAIGGYTLIRAESLEDATEIAKGCPIFQFGGSVEVRAINPL